jgi:hypothetical protein
MIFIFGLRLFGKVDVVPGRFHVATEFYHIQFLPIVPMQTYLVLEEDVDGWRGVKIPLCRKSMTAAWLRTGLFIVAVIAAVLAAVEGSRAGGGQWQQPAGIALAAAAMFAASKWSRAFTHADCKRACELARLAGYRERGIEELRAEFGEAGDEESESGTDGEGAEATSAEPRMFFVSGRQRDTGQDVCVTVWATDDQHARSISVQRGIDISDVERAAR